MMTPSVLDMEEWIKSIQHCIEEENHQSGNHYQIAETNETALLEVIRIVMEELMSR
jgi:hypothetical protein